MIVGISVFELHLHSSRSLKDKRRVVKSLIDRLHQRYRVSIAETDFHDLHQRAEIAMAVVVAGGESELEKMMDEVRDTFKVPKIGTIAGCHVVEGVIPRTAAVRLLRDNRVIYEGKIASLRRFKDDASEVRTGFDCGIGLERFQDFKPGDVIEAYTNEEVAPVL